MYGGAGNATNRVHAMEHYGAVKPESWSWPKVLLDPDATFGHHVHDAIDLPGFHHTTVDHACIRVLHLQNLFRKRYRDWQFYDKMTVPIDSFQWVLDEPAELVDRFTLGP